MTITEEKTEVLKEFTQEKLLGYDKIIAVIKETQSRIEGLDRKWRALIDREKEETEKDKLRDEPKERVKEKKDKK